MWSLRTVTSQTASCEDDFLLLECVDVPYRA